MADATALAATIGGSAVALLGILVTYRTARAQHRFERERAHDARLWESRSTVYEELLAFAHRNMLAVERTYPPGGSAWGDPPGMLPDEVYTTLQARVAIFGSEQTLRALKEFNERVKAFFDVANEIRSREEQGADVDQRRIDVLRESVRRSLRTLEGCSRDDLTSLEPATARSAHG